MLRCVVMGSFKSKPKIDEAINQFQGLGVQILAPELGRLNRSEHIGFFPLDSELHLSPGLVEEQFLNCLRRTSFAYLVNPDGYVGNTVSMEIGFCIAGLIPIFSKYPIDLTLGEDPSWKEIVSWVTTKTPKEVVELQTPKDMWVPNIFDVNRYSRR